MTTMIFLLILCLPPLLTWAQELRIIDQPMVASVYEREGSRISIQRVTCVGGVPPYSIVRADLSPRFDACERCFDVYDMIDGTAEGDFRLYFLPSQGSLSYRRVRTYNVSVVCLDSTNNVTSPAIIDVRIRTNEPPFFNNFNGGSFRGTCDLRAQTVAANTEVQINPYNPFDPDNDPMFFTMTIDPPDAANFFEINPTTGRIRTTKSLRSYCHSFVSFSIMAQDTEGNSIGPFVGTCTIPDAYQPPTISNVNKEISVTEDTPVDTVLVSPFLRTTPITPAVTYDIDTFPASALSNIAIENRRGVQSLVLKKTLDFEAPATQNFNISIRPQNSFCTAVEHFIYIRTTDANDTPRLLPKNVTKTVDEGTIVVNPEWLLTEEDFSDQDFFSIIGGNEDGLWSIDPSTGIVMSSSVIDLDPNIRERNWTLTIEVEDLAGAKDNATLTIVVEDFNDNAPTFTQAVYPVTVMDCDSPRNLGIVLAATDIDSDLKNNNKVHFRNASNEFIQIFTDGTAFIKKIPPLGTSSSLSTNAVDEGEVPPGPRTSTQQGTILVTTVPCTTTTVAPTVSVVVNNTNNNNANSNSNSNANANANATSNGNSGGTVFAGVNSLITSGTNTAGTGVGDIVLWVLAGLLGLLLLAALAYLIFRYCAKFCTGSSSWSDGCGCNRAKTPRHIRPFSQERAVSRQKEDFKKVKKEEEEEEEEEEIVQASAPAPVVYGNTVVPVAKTNRFLRVRRLVPVKPQQVKVRSLVPIPPGNTGFPNGVYRPIGANPTAPRPTNSLASYQPAPVGQPTGTNTRPVQGGVNTTYQ